MSTPHQVKTQSFKNLPEPQAEARSSLIQSLSGNEQKSNSRTGKRTSASHNKGSSLVKPLSGNERKSSSRTSKRTSTNHAKKRSILTNVINPENRKKCERKIPRSRFERLDPETRQWWERLFGILEEDASIPPFQRGDILKEVFPERILDKILTIISVKNKKFKEELDRKQLEVEKFPDLSSHTESAETDSKRPVSQRSNIDDKEYKLDIEEYGRKRGVVSKMAVQSQMDLDAYNTKMYIEFFKRKPNRAAVWRSLPPLSMEEMNLNQKAEAITENIATSFIDWLRDLGGDEELSLSVKQVIEMFQIGFYADSATSLKVDIKEMPSVPYKVAEARNMPYMAKRAVLHHEIRRDILASKKTIKLTAFGRRLPTDMQTKPPAEQDYRKWMSCDKVPEKLSTMATVWQGITHLKSTRAFCEFLLEKPEIRPPKYLLDCGMLNPQNLNDQGEDFSLDDVADYGHDQILQQD